MIDTIGFIILNPSIIGQILAIQKRAIFAEVNFMMSNLLIL